LTKAYDEAVKKKDWALAKSLHRKDPKCWIEGDDFDENSIGRDEDSGFSTSGGETDATNTRQPEPQKENCSELQKKFQAALDSGDFNWARSILNDARDCGFYDKASQALQSALDAQAEAQRPPQPERSPQPERNPQPDRNPQPEGSQPPPVDVQYARQSDFVGTYLEIDPARSYAQYHAMITLFQNGELSLDEWISGSKRTNRGKWIYNESSKVLYYKIDDTVRGPGGYFSGKVTGNTNDFVISGRFADGTPGQLRLTRK
jgi:hypothetical protein